MPSERRLTANAIRGRKSAAFPVITAYDVAFARCVEDAGIDVILVGDTLGHVVLGFPSTVNVDLEDMCRHVGAVSRGTKRAHIVGDMPFGSYEPSDARAVESAIALVKAGATSVKLEGGERVVPRIAAMCGAGVPVVGHIGVAPQTAALDAGFRRKSDRERLLADGRAIEDAGAFAVVLEMVDSAIADELTRTLSIPTIGIGSGPKCDAQVLVLYDMLGLYPEPPPFAKKFADLTAVATDALREYAREVREGSFPPSR